MQWIQFDEPVRRERYALQQMTAAEMAVLISRESLKRSGNRVPTLGELESTSLLLLNQIDVFQEELHTEMRVWWYEAMKASVRSYWTVARLNILPQTVKMCIEMTIEGSALNHVQSLVSEIAEVLAIMKQSDAFNAFDAAMREQKKLHRTQVRQKERELLSKAELNAYIRSEALKEVDASDYPHIVQVTIEVFKRGLEDARNLLQLPNEFVLLQQGGRDLSCMTHGSLLHHVREPEFRRHVEQASFISAVGESSLSEAIDRIKKRGPKRQDDPRDQILLGGEMSALGTGTGNVPALMRVFEQLGLDPCAPATRIVRRIDERNDHTYWYLYPLANGRTAYVVKCGHETNLDVLGVYDGTTDDVTTMVQKTFERSGSNISLETGPNVPRCIADAFHGRKHVERYQALVQQITQYVSSRT